MLKYVKFDKHVAKQL